MDQPVAVVGQCGSWVRSGSVICWCGCGGWLRPASSLWNDSNSSNICNSGHKRDVGCFARSDNTPSTLIATYKPCLLSRTINKEASSSVELRSILFLYLHLHSSHDHIEPLTTHLQIWNDKNWLAKIFHSDIAVTVLNLNVRMFSAVVLTCSILHLK